MFGGHAQDRVVFLTPAAERDLHAAIESYLKRRSLGLEDLFAVLDSDLDGALEVHGEMSELMLDAMPSLAATELQYFLVSKVGGQPYQDLVLTC